MRKFSLILVAALILGAGSLYANNLPSKEPAKNLTNLIGTLLEDYADYASEVTYDLTAVVKFTVNEHQEIVVLTVQTEDAALESFIKGRLNYEKAEDVDAKEGRIYIVPVRIDVLN